MDRMPPDPPHLTLVPTRARAGDEPGEQPLRQREAAAMWDCAVSCRTILMRLPQESDLRHEWLEACDDALLAARLSWPRVEQRLSEAPR